MDTVQGKFAPYRIYGLYDSTEVPKQPKKFDAKKGVRRLARERVGTVPAARVIEPKPRRKKPKHKKPPEVETLDT